MNIPNRDNSDCIEINLERYDDAIDIPIAWSLDSTGGSGGGGNFFGSLASGILPGNESTASACWNHTTEFDWSCAEFRATSQAARDEAVPYGRFLLRWNDVVWADHPFDLRKDESLAWIGHDCQSNWFQICKYQNDVWLLDVGLTTGNETGNVYWRVYVRVGDVEGRRGNLLHDPYFGKYQPFTSYHSLNCIPDWGSNACTEFGLKNDSFVSDITLRVNGKERNHGSWYCDKELCNGDIVTPLRGCSSKDDLYVTFVAIILVFVAIFVILIVVLWRRKQRRNRREANDPGEQTDQKGTMSNEP